MDTPNEPDKTSFSDKLEALYKAEEDSPFAVYEKQNQELNVYMRMTEEDFGALSDRERDIIVFRLLRENLAQTFDVARVFRATEALVTKLGDLATKWDTDEGRAQIISEMTAAAMKNFGGGMLGGF